VKVLVLEVSLRNTSRELVKRGVKELGEDEADPSSGEVKSATPVRWCPPGLG